MQYVLGVDGGNSKTIALVAALDGTILGAGRGSCGDIYNAPVEGTPWPDAASAAIANIEAAVEAALHAAQIKASQLEAAVFSMAGADWPEDFALLHAAMRVRGYGRRLIVQNDALGVLHAGVADNVGVSVVCGTGGATGARGRDGRVWHSSNWQDQVQGGAMLSRKALDAVVRAEVGIDPPTSLKQRFLDYFGLHTVEEMLHLHTGRGLRLPKRLDGLTRYLLDEAAAGDNAARTVVLEHGRGMGNYAIVGARNVGLEGSSFALVLAGGVLRHPSTLLADTIVERVSTTSPGVRPIRCRYEPVVGVLFSALEMAEIVIDDTLLQRLNPSLPAPELFATTHDYTLR
jgi:N-acetylglucosamine kinase-like BadF-type ATPase